MLYLLPLECFAYFVYTNINGYADITFVLSHHLFRSELHGPKGQTLSPEDVVKAGALDKPSGLDFSGDMYPVRILYVLIKNMPSTG